MLADGESPVERPSLGLDHQWVGTYKQIDKNWGGMGVLEKGLHYLVNILNFVEIPFTYFGV